MNRPPLLGALAGAAAGALALATPASGQNALGDGTRLDRPLQRSGPTFNPPQQDFAASVRLRNAIVTGNAPDGLSFRGDVGYRAPGEFSGVLGSNDLFTFRRDSLYSGLAGQGIRGTEALQYQFSLTQGNRAGGSLLAAPVARSGTGVNAAAIVNPQGEARADLDGGVSPLVARPGSTPADADQDQRGLNLWTLRSPAAYISTRNLEATLMGTTQDAAGAPHAITASPLTGLRAEPIGPGSVPPRDEAEPEPRPGAAAPLNADPGRIDMAAASTAENLSAVPAAPQKSAYEQLVERLAWQPGMPVRQTGPTDPAAAANEAARQEALAELDQQIAQLRHLLTGEGEPPAAAPGAEGAEGAEGEPAREPGAVDPRVLDLLRQRSGEVSDFARPGFDAYAEHMRRGQELLAAERYFDAEERFAAAMSRRAADPMAAVGRLHAQIGASMFLSATVNLRSLLTANPELIGTRYAKNLLPSSQRIGEIIARLDELITAGRGLPPDAGLLLAYLGYQTGDRTAIVRGLNAASVAARGTEETPGDERLETLVRVLRDVWLGQNAAPAGAPAAPAAPTEPAPTPEPGK